MNDNLCMFFREAWLEIILDTFTLTDILLTSF